MPAVRLGTFNLENLDEDGVVALDRRISVLRPQLARMRADILCLQEVNGQPGPGGSRELRSLDRLLEETAYAGFHRAVTTHPKSARVSDKHNLVVLSRWPIAAARQYHHDLVPPADYRQVTGDPGAPPAPVTWERPAQHVEIALDGATLHLFNLHLRSRLASLIPGHKTGPFSWDSAAAWAEGAFLSAVKRSGQALEARLAIDRVFDADADALIAVCGDLNAEADEVPVEILRADTDNTGNAALATRALVALESPSPAPSAVSMMYHGRGIRLDHLLVSRALLTWYRGSEVHNELLHDEAVALAAGTATGESYHAPIVATFEPPPRT